MKTPKHPCSWWWRPKDHVHMSEKRRQRLHDGLMERLVDKEEADTTPRVHMDGWPDRPQPERPDRGRNSEPVAKGAGAPRPFSKPGDLLAFKVRRWWCNGYVEAGSKQLDVGPIIYDKNLTGVPTLDKACMYLGHDDQPYPHRVLHDGVVYRCTEAMLRSSFRIVRRVEKASG